MTATHFIGSSKPAPKTSAGLLGAQGKTYPYRRTLNPPAGPIAISPANKKRKLPMSVRSIAVACIAIVLSACAAPLQRVDADAVKLAPVRSIAVIRAPEPKSFTVLNIGHVGGAFGIIGAAIAEADRASKESKLSEAFKAQGMRINGLFADGLVRRLTEMGYDARVEDGTWQEEGGKYKLPTEKIASTADAVVVPEPQLIGFVSPQDSTDYMPTVRIVATVLGKNRNEVLYRGYYSAGAPVIFPEGWKHLPPVARFPNFDALMADTKVSAESIVNAGAALAEAVASELRKQRQ